MVTTSTSLFGLAPTIGETLVCKHEGGNIMLTTDTLSISTCYKFRCTKNFNYQENNVFLNLAILLNAKFKCTLNICEIR